LRFKKSEWKGTAGHYAKKANVFIKEEGFFCPTAREKGASHRKLTMFGGLRAILTGENTFGNKKKSRAPEKASG